MPRLDKLVGKLNFTEIPEKLCWTTPEKFLGILKQYGFFSLDTTKDWNFVVIGYKSPSPDDVDKLWVRLDKNRNFLGFFLYLDGKWREAIHKSLGEITWFYGDSREIPAGYKLAIKENFAGSNFPDLKPLFIRSDIDPSVYSYYAGIFVGY